MTGAGASATTRGLLAAGRPRNRAQVLADGGHSDRGALKAGEGGRGPAGSSLGDRKLRVKARDAGR